jgi:streptogramin lyase
VCDPTTDKIYNIETDGTWISEFATSVFDEAATNIQAASYAADGTLWVCDITTDKIYNIQTDGTLISSFAISKFGSTDPTGISYAADGTLWVCDLGTDKIYNIETDGTPISEFATSVFDAAATAVRGMSYAADGTLWVCDDNADKIYNVKPTQFLELLEQRSNFKNQTMPQLTQMYLVIFILPTINLLPNSLSEYLLGPSRSLSLGKQMFLLSLLS